MSILSCIDGYMNGNAWEDLCIKIYRLRYQDNHYTPISATQGGDGGIEGFTQSGVVNQCYCPEKKYSDQECYEHTRNKMTKDIKKLLDPKYQKRLLEWGVPPIREWHFVIPEQNDSRLIKHAEDKRKEVLATKKESPNNYPCIHEDFKIIIKVAEDFKPEIGKIVLAPYQDYLLKLSLEKGNHIDHGKCDSTKAENILRKMKAIRQTDDDADPDVVYLVEQYTKFYLRGIDKLNILRMNFPDAYEMLIQLEQACKSDVSIKTRLNTDKNENYKLFNEILNDFENKLKEQFSNAMSLASISEIKQDLVASWLADCSMEFRK